MEKVYFKQIHEMPIFHIWLGYKNIELTLRDMLKLSLLETGGLMLELTL